ncbi:hypothetical protein EV356DRAFT_505457, partial [Viridothelium virens]
MADIASFDDDPTLYLFTSLTAGSSHIITATSRLETILKANKIPFQALDTATEERARKLWGRRAGKRKLPGLVKQGMVLGDLEQIEEWNEFGELKENIGPTPSLDAAPSGPSSADLASKPGQTANTLAPSTSTSHPSISANPQPGAALRQLGTEAAAVANAKKTGGTPLLPKAGVDASKMRPLPSDVAAAPREATAAAATGGLEARSGAEREKEKGMGVGKENEAPVEEVLSLVLDDAATKPETMNSSVGAKRASVEQAKENADEVEKAEAATSVEGEEGGKLADVTNVGEGADMGAGKDVDGTLHPSNSGKDLAAKSQDNLAAVGLSVEEKQGAGAEQIEHRGSSVNLVDDAEVKEVEKATAIPEVKEEEEETATGGEAKQVGVGEVDTKGDLNAVGEGAGMKTQE